MSGGARSVRLDQLLVTQGLYPSREKARRAVMAGCIEVAGHVVDKPGAAVRADCELRVRERREPFVSRAGRKLAAALDHFGIDPAGKLCLDVGASTGGFTDCLLQRGAERVVAIDVGRGQLDFELRRDPRVVALEGVNARYLRSEDLPYVADLASVDVSFISVCKVVPALIPCVRPGGELVILIKPQFEAPRGSLAKGGILRDEGLRSRVVEETSASLRALGLACVGVVDAALPGLGGNLEAVGYYRIEASS